MSSRKDEVSIQMALEARADLERAIFAATRNFEAVTGLKVESVDIAHRTEIGHGEILVETKVEVRL